MSFPASTHRAGFDGASTGTIAPSVTGAVAPPYQVRPGELRDRRPVEDLVFSRLGQLPGDACFRDNLQSARDIVTNMLGIDNDGRPTVWLLTDGPEIIGCTALLAGTLAPGWSEEQRDEPALSVLALFTDPAHRHDRPSRFLIWWALDHASPGRGSYSNSRQTR
ncbi:hypothetical protein ACH4PU_32545 [Streptomyces sp. NPDC021100]|uniref:hypothetical protein n=1 Tax=Streptomyces sp. NPDC021100 TaxID=3365114 RepID=UPI0037BBD78F